jgi:hypothetical protein
MAKHKVALRQANNMKIVKEVLCMNGFLRGRATHLRECEPKHVPIPQENSQVQGTSFANELFFLWECERTHKNRRILA